MGKKLIQRGKPVVYKDDVFVDMIDTDFVITTRTVVDGDGKITKFGLNRYDMVPFGSRPRKTTMETTDWLTMYI